MPTSGHLLPLDCSPEQQFLQQQPIYCSGQVSPGAGLAVFAVMTWAVLLWNRSGGVRRDCKDWIAIGLMLATAAQTVVETGFANICLLLALTVYAAGHFLHREIHPYWRRLLEGFAGLAWLPASILGGKCKPPQLKLSDHSGVFAEIAGNTWRWVRALLPAAVLTIPFALLLLGGNAILFSTLETWVDTAVEFLQEIELPSFARMVFWAFIFTTMLALLGKGAPSRLLAWIEERVPQSCAQPSDLSMAVLRTRLVLIAVNVLFFFANTTDVFYLWAQASLPEGVTPSEFVHQGVYSLIGSVILAAVVLSLLFVQNRAVCTARGQRFLAHLWIVQNLVLVSSVVLRLKLYVDTFQLSLLRVYVVCFLVLVSVGFVLLAIRIQRERTLSWLVGSNLLAVFSLFFIMQCWDEHRFVAKWNVDAAGAAGTSAKVLDTGYLAKLGPAAWPYLAQVADNPGGFGRRVSNDAATTLAREAVDYRANVASDGWRGWQWHRAVAARVLR